MNLSKGSALVLRNGLVELVILALLNLGRLAGPDRLRLVAQLPIPSGFVNLKKNSMSKNFIFVLLGGGGREFV